MDLNRFSYYRANPYSQNDYIPSASMINRKRKQFPSEIPQGQEYHPAKSGKRIFKEKVNSDEIQKDKILNSPQRYPFENRIALDKTYSRNLDTIDIQGASSGTKVSQSIKNKHKALQQLRRRNGPEPKKSLMGQSLDQVYQKQRRGLAQKIYKEIQMRKTKQSFSNHNSTKDLQQVQSKTPRYPSNQNTSKVNSRDIQAQYERYVSGNSNQKYNSVASNSFEYQGFQRYKRPEKTFQTIDHYNYGRIPQQPPLKRQNIGQFRYQSIDQDNYSKKNQTNIRSPSIQINSAGRPIQQSHNPGSLTYTNNSSININNRHRSNPEYVQNFPTELQKRISQSQRNKQLQSGIKNIYQYDRAQFRRNNPTNLSFNIAAKSSLMGPII